MGDRDLLLEMGFPLNKVEKALKATKNAGLQPAIDWLSEHADDPEVTEEEVAASGEQSAEAATEGETPVAQSFVCNDCGKQLRDNDALQFHAAKTGHANFQESKEEVKPLTEEEKAAQIEKIKVLLAEKKEREKQEMIAKAKENERLRRKAGQEAVEFREKMAQKEMQDALAARKREKLEEKMARDRVKAQIEQDRLEKARKLQEQAGIFKAPAPAAPASTSTATVSNSDNSRIQVRFTDGVPAATSSFGASEALEVVFKKVSEHRKQNGKPSTMSFTLSTNIAPKKTFTLEADGKKTLKELGI